MVSGSAAAVGGGFAAVGGVGAGDGSFDVCIGAGCAEATPTLGCCSGIFVVVVVVGVFGARSNAAPQAPNFLFFGVDAASLVGVGVGAGANSPVSYDTADAVVVAVVVDEYVAVAPA